MSKGPFTGSGDYRLNKSHLYTAVKIYMLFVSSIFLHVNRELAADKHLSMAGENYRGVIICSGQ